MRPDRIVLVGVVSATLTACATTPEPTIRTVEVKVPIPVPCAAEAPPRPTYADSPSALKGAPDIAERVRLLLAGREQRDGYIAGLEAASTGCR
ncbi:MAG: hypothetical protein ABS78_15570 [Phenylobacterium sp. SCN 70-31]|nr:MAG: hypothetical protein ABS78_15570 [Phenylobacterium sp. SCN 70-31]